jgi:hypothetical protein
LSRSAAPMHRRSASALVRRSLLRLGGSGRHPGRATGSVLGVTSSGVRISHPPPPEHCLTVVAYGPVATDVKVRRAGVVAEHREETTARTSRAVAPVRIGDEHDGTSSRIIASGSLPRWTCGVRALPTSRSRCAVAACSAPSGCRVLVGTTVVAVPPSCCPSRSASCSAVFGAGGSIGGEQHAATTFGAGSAQGEQQQRSAAGAREVEHRAAEEEVAPGGLPTAADDDDVGPGLVRGSSAARHSSSAGRPSRTRRRPRTPRVRGPATRAEPGRARGAGPRSLGRGRVRPRRARACHAPRCGRGPIPSVPSRCRRRHRPNPTASTVQRSVG